MLKEIIDNQYYPTPPHVIAAMVAPHLSRFVHTERRDAGRVSVTSLLGFVNILEPSAGDGGILDYLVDKHGLSKRGINAIELAADFRTVLQGKGYRVVGSDFLAFDDPYKFDVVIMNPPFADGDSHLLKAWQVVADGGHVICLLNAETINNPYSRERQVVSKIIQAHGSVEPIGRAFKNAERPTDVECVIVRLQKPKRGVGWDFRGTYEQDAAVDVESGAGNELATADLIQAIIDQYNVARAALIDNMRSGKAVAYYTQGLGRHFNNASYALGDINEQLDTLKKGFWGYVFERTKVGAVTTSNFQKKFEEYKEGAGLMAFTRENIAEVLAMFYENRDAIMQECILSVFDDATRYHRDNIYHPEGWAHNKGWMVAKKIIMPNVVESNGFYWSMRWSGNGQFVDDLDKAMCFVSGVQADQVLRVRHAINGHFDKIKSGAVDYNAEFETEFFRIRVYKKGTMHITFKDELIWRDFNRRAAEGKMWVGDGNSM